MLATPASPVLRTSRVHRDTLYDEFIAGYEGVMMGISACTHHIRAAAIHNEEDGFLKNWN